MLFKKHALENDVKKIAPIRATKGSWTPKKMKKKWKNDVSKINNISAMLKNNFIKEIKNNKW